MTLTYEHAEDLTRQPRVNLRRHDKWDTYPLATQQLLANGQAAIDNLAAAMERTRAAREPFTEPRKCGAKGVDAVCVRPEHPLWEQHETWDGHWWFPGEAPR